MKPSRVRNRVQAYVLVLAVLCLVSTFRFAWESPQPSRPLGESPFGDYLRRFDELKKALPARGVVGYVDNRADNPLGPGYYYAVQYALAPLVVERSTERNLVVGNFTSAAVTSQYPANLVPIRDFGQGVILFTQRHR